MNNSLISPAELSRMMGQQFPPTEQQAAIIGAPIEPMLVVAGAGAGKTETMAARVVWLVANGFVRPEEILGLTFTVKAASELNQRIRQRLLALAHSHAFQQQAAPEVLEALDVIAPTVSTYDAYAGELVRNYGLLLPTEPQAAIIDSASQWQYAWDVVQSAKSVNADIKPDKMTSSLLALNAHLDAALANSHDVRDETQTFRLNLINLPQKRKNQNPLIGDLQKIVERQEQRLALLEYIDQMRSAMAAENASTFAMQLSRAARLAMHVPDVGQHERSRFKVIMLDEYQDTSHAQRLLLKSLYAGSCVTAVGDPMQAIYSWRGATAENLLKFVTDYRQSDGKPAEKKQLTISWRNPETILQLANIVSDHAFCGAERTVEPLQAGPKAGAGEVQLACFATGREEVDFICNKLAAEYQNAEQTGQKLSAAILVRSNNQIAEFIEALAQRGVPAVSLGTTGFLELPEILDIRAVMHVLVDTSANEAMMRLLTSPLFNLGAADIKQLEKRARELAKYANSAVKSAVDDMAESENDDEESQTPLTRFVQRLDQLVDSDSKDAVSDSLVLAVADPDIRYADGTQIARGTQAANGALTSALAYSKEGMRRIVKLGAILRSLRKYSLGKPLPELIGDIEEALDIRAEAQAGRFGYSTAITEATTAQLDQFVNAAARYSQNQSDNVVDFLKYLEYAVTQDKGLELAPVSIRGNRIEVLTMHKAKGLEWDTVAIPRVISSVFDEPGRQWNCWLTAPEKLPPGVAIAASDDEENDGVPDLDVTAADDQSEARKLVEEYKKELKALDVEENRRVFYVALTRAAKTLLVTCPLRFDNAQKAREPSDDLKSLAKACPEFVVHWCTDAPDHIDDEVSPFDPAANENYLMWPVDTLGSRNAVAHEAAEMVEKARSLLREGKQEIEPIPGDLTQLWDTETALLIDEIERAQARTIELPMPTTLSTSEYQALIADRDVFARRKARPVPFKPNRFARRGTAFHAWLENKFGMHALLDDEDLYSSSVDFFSSEEESFSESELERLKEKFQASEWSNRVPEQVEVPFEIGIGGKRILGRIDAVFRIDGTWMVVDWKTGRKPTGEDARRAALQLAIYRIALADLLRARGENVAAEDIRSAFFYVGQQTTVEPDKKNLPSRLELDKAIKELL